MKNFSNTLNTKISKVECFAPAVYVGPNDELLSHSDCPCRQSELSLSAVRCPAVSKSHSRNGHYHTEIMFTQQTRHAYIRAQQRPAITLTRSQFTKVRFVTSVPQTKDSKHAWHPTHVSKWGTGVEVGSAQWRK